MEITTFYKLLGQKCQEATRRNDHDCRKCAAQEFCYTAPASMNREIMDGVLAILACSADDEQQNTRRENHGH